MTISSINIRPANVADADVIGLLLTQLGYPATTDRATQVLKSALSDEQQAVFVAELDGAVLGLAAITSLFYLHLGERIARLSSLVVKESARGQQVGQRLLRAAEQWAIAQGCSQLELTSSVKRERAHRFYVRAGYQPSAYRFVRCLTPAE